MNVGVYVPFTLEECQLGNVSFVLIVSVFPVINGVVSKLFPVPKRGTRAFSENSHI